MKKLLLILFSLLLLVACSNKDNEESSQVADIDEDELREIIESSGIEEGDELVSLSVEEGEIHAIISIGISDTVRPEDLAISRYNSLSTKVLEHEGWEVLTVEFSDVGTISIERDKAQTNELGVFFPLKLIERNLELEEQEED